MPAIGFYEVVFLLGTLCVAHTYIIYPASMALLARYWRRPVRSSGRYQGTFSVVLPVRNEAGSLARRIDELSALIRGTGLPGELIVVVNGSCDNSAQVARSSPAERVTVLEIPDVVGKSSALAQAAAIASGDVLVFADARQRWADAALGSLLSNFTDPTIGAASGDLVLESDPGVIEGVGVYWRFEKWLRWTEGEVHSIVGVTGSISAVRRDLFHAPPKGTVLDDVYWPLRVVMAGYRVVHDRDAQAFDRLPPDAGQEFKRKVRTLAGNLQLIGRLPEALLPWRNPVWYQYMSHKVLRLIAPWALAGMLVSSFMMNGSMYVALAVAQALFYVAAIIGILLGSRAKARLFTVSGSFLLLNLAALVAFWVWATGGVEKSWQQTNYGTARGSEIM